MSDSHQYLTIAQPGEGSTRVKGSRFLAFAYPVSSEEEIREALGILRKAYHDATHHCYAWRLGAEMDRFRINDDGEPSGTAGHPIFGQIQSMNLTNILVVVVRYFGGTLLGVGGLIQAYREAARDALGKTGTVRRKVESEISIRFEYAQMNKVMSLVKEYKIETKDHRFDLVCTMSLTVWNRILENVLSRIELIEDCQVEKITST